MKTAQIDIPRSTSRTTTPEQERTSIGAPIMYPNVLALAHRMYEKKHCQLILTTLRVSIKIGVKKVN